MTLFEWLRRKPAVAPDRLSNRRVLVRPARVVRGRYDAAQTTADNERHWANADFLAADAANSPEVRRALRCRARYEVANNSFSRRMALWRGPQAPNRGLASPIGRRALPEKNHLRFDR